MLDICQRAFKIAIPFLSHLCNSIVTDRNKLCLWWYLCFATIAEKTKENINPSGKHFSEFQKSRTQNIISSFDSKKSVGPNSIPTKIFNLLKNDISSQLADIFNISFSSGVFPTILKVASVAPIYKKDSKLDCSNYQPILLLSNIEKILEKLMYNKVYIFLLKIISFICSSLVLDSSIPLFMP